MSPAKPKPRIGMQHASAHQLFLLQAHETAGAHESFSTKLLSFTSKRVHPFGRANPENFGLRNFTININPRCSNNEQQHFYSHRIPYQEVKKNQQKQQIMHNPTFMYMIC
jgi:hypothetical protein